MAWVLVLRVIFRSLKFGMLCSYFHLLQINFSRKSVLSIIWNFFIRLQNTLSQEFNAGINYCNIYILSPAEEFTPLFCFVTKFSNIARMPGTMLMLYNIWMEWKYNFFGFQLFMLLSTHCGSHCFNPKNNLSFIVLSRRFWPYRTRFLCFHGTKSFFQLCLIPVCFLSDEVAKTSPLSEYQKTINFRRNISGSSFSLHAMHINAWS